jgi:hypothetical protein
MQVSYRVLAGGELLPVDVCEPRVRLELRDALNKAAAANAPVRLQVQQLAHL